MKKETFLKLLTKKLSGDIPDGDSELLRQAIDRNEEYKELAAGLERYFHSNESIAPKTDRLRHTWDKIGQHQGDDFKGMFDYSAPRRPAYPLARLLKIAAVLAVFLTIGLIGYRLMNPGAGQAFNTVAASNQKIFRMLDDGTRIWLNKNSSLRYNSSFGKHRREIFLEGEAYFDVARNKDVPLFIHAGDIDIEVKGTAFNVNAYPTNPEIQVSLVRGSIEVRHRLDKTQKVLLKPKQRLVFSTLQRNGNSRPFLVLPLDQFLLSGTIRWTADTLTFRKERLGDLAIRLEKKYDVKIDIQSEPLQNKRFSGTLTTETIHEALEALRLSYPFTYTISDKLITIKD